MSSEDAIEHLMSMRPSPSEYSDEHLYHVAYTTWEEMLTNLMRSDLAWKLVLKHSAGHEHDV